jgi:hypothetical protein
VHGAARQRDRVKEERRVIEDPGERELDDVARFTINLEKVGRVVVEKIRRVAEAFFAHEA